MLLYLKIRLYYTFVLPTITFQRPKRYKIIRPIEKIKTFQTILHYQEYISGNHQILMG